jgi:uncharacterized repeat protein (TIGR03803 family)
MRPKRRAPGLVQAVVSISLALAATQAWAGSKYAVLHNFDYGMKDQIGPPGGPPALDAAGNLYGGAGGGVGCGGYGCGLIYRLRPRGEGGWALSVVYEFMGGSGGSFPQQVMFDDAGDLYGTLAGDGGAAVAGVYELARKDAKWDFSMLYSPGGCCLVLGGAGRVYGAIGAGKYGSGAVSELLHGSKGWVLKTLYSFCNPQSCPDGDGPVAPLTWDSRGNLYGTALYGGNGPPKCPGSLGCGVAFQMTPNSNGTWKYHVLHRFAAFSYDGRYPYAGLVVDASGNVYGATYLGGSHGNGTIFKLTRSSSGQWTQTALYDFPNCADGCGPDTSLVFDKAGNLYGTGGGGNTVCGGGGYYCGVIYKLTPQANGQWRYSVLHKFNSADGAGANGVIVDSKGNLFGTTITGGAFNFGVAFEITP